MKRWLFLAYCCVSLCTMWAQTSGLRVKEPTDLRQLSDVATLYLNTEDARSVSSKSTYLWARMWEVLDGEVTVYDSLRIRGRGNSTWGLAKKPYRLKFLQKERMLGKGRANAKNWTLMANHADKTLLRNSVAACIGTTIGQPFTAGTRFVDFVLNGTYIGCYQISDFVDIRKHRVDITEQDETLTPDADITGGYLFEADGFAGGEQGYWRTQGGVPMAVKSPDAEVITSAQASYLHDFMNDFEARLTGSAYMDPEKGYRAVVDSMTLISWFLGTEYTANTDGYWSVYLYKEQQDPLLYWGPMWDYDIAFCNDSRVPRSTQQLMLENGHGGGVVKPWVQRMWTDPWFRALASRHWQKCREEGLLERTLQQVDSLAQVINQSQALNFGIYPINSRVYDEVQVFSSYQEGVDYLKNFLRQHATYLDGVFNAQIPTPEPNPNPNPNPPDPNPNPGEDPQGEYFVPNPRYRYYIYNAGTKHRVDVSSEGLCTWTPSEERYATQVWNVLPVDTLGTCMLLSADSLMAITDPALQSGDRFATGAQILMQPTDRTNPRQQWLILRTANNWSIVNAHTHNAWNNSGGGSSDGNHVISWTNDANNASKATRQWYFEVAEEIIPPAPEPEPEPSPEPEPDIPESGVPFVLRHLATDLYINLVQSDTKCTILGLEPDTLYFTPSEGLEGGSTVVNRKGYYMGRHTNSWNMSSSLPELWDIEETEDGIALHSHTGGGNGYLGFDNITVGSPAYRDKDYERYHGLFALEPVEDTEPEPEPGPTVGMDAALADYIVSYSASEQCFMVRAAQADMPFMNGWIELRTLSGQLLRRQGSLCPLSTAALPSGTYILRWCVNGHQRSRKVAIGDATMR